MMLSASDIANILKLPLQGDPKRQFSAFKSLVDAGPDDVSYAEAKFSLALQASKAGLVITTAALADQHTGLAVISNDPRADFARLLRHVYPSPPVEPGIHPSAVIDPSAKIASDVAIGPFVVIGARAILGEGAVIGAHCIIEDGVHVGAQTRLDGRVTLYANTQIGARCHLSAGCVIGAAGFGYVRESTGWQPFPQIACVIIGDDVDIGANTCIDRGALTPTSIANGVKIDNQVQIGHGVKIGAQTIISGCVGIGGSTEIGAGCMLGGASSIKDNISLCDGVFLSGFCGVSKSINTPGLYAANHHVEPFQQWQRKQYRFKKLNEWLSQHSLKELLS
jgi:UDP-3-O-[3-hydroxymyristoyl] glucosamine N-acyltransferase